MNTDKFVEKYITFRELVCNDCKHREFGELKCSAFPDGIPDEIIDGKNDHKKPLPGQGNDIVFEPEDS